MLDVLRQFRNIPKEAQGSLVTLPDLLIEQDRVVQCLQMMSDKPFPGGEGESATRAATRVPVENRGNAEAQYST